LVTTITNDNASSIERTTKERQRVPPHPWNETAGPATLAPNDTLGRTTEGGAARIVETDVVLAAGENSEDLVQRIDVPSFDVSNVDPNAINTPDMVDRSGAPIDPLMVQLSGESTPPGDAIDAMVRGDSNWLVRADRWLESRGLNNVGDPIDTMYAGGTPLFNEGTGEMTDRETFLRGRFPEETWNNDATTPAGDDMSRDLPVGELAPIPIDLPTYTSIDQVVPDPRVSGIDGAATDSSARIATDATPTAPVATTALAPEVDAASTTLTAASDTAHLLQPSDDASHHPA